MVGCVVLMAALAACSGAAGYKVPALPDAGGSGDDGGQAGLPVTGIDSNQLGVTGVQPNSGPFSGGNTVVVRGSAFTAKAVVRIGGHMVDPSKLSLSGKGRLSVVVPAGNVGPADVSVTQGGVTATLRKGYSYNALQLDPQQGSIAGGTFVDITVSSASFDDKVQITFGDKGKACGMLRLVTPKRVRCAVPAHALGVVDVQASWPNGGHAPVLAKGAFEYIDTSDADRGGLSGGPIAGTINVTVVDQAMGLVVPGALVMVGDNPKTKYKGLTDTRGSITFSGPDLKGPVTVHVSMKCFERSSIVAFDAQNVTVFISPLLDLACLKMSMLDGSGGSGGHGQLGALISGELIFPGSDEFGINAWDIVPKPRSGELRVAYVYTTRVSADTRNPSPSGGGTIAKVEEQTARRGSRGYKYRIFARPAGLAVYALCGIERSATGEFTPYVMGVARNVVTSPGDEATGVDIDMSITLDRELDVTLSHVPAPTAKGPTDFRVRAHVDLGGEGVIVREVSGTSLDTKTSFSNSSAFRFLGQPAFVGPLADASYELIAGYYTNQTDPPYTSLRRFGVRPSSEPVVIDDLLGIAQNVAPALGGDIPADRQLRFELTGATPDFILVELTGGDGNPAWMQVLPGTARSVPVPDLSSIPGQTDLVPGFITWTVQAIRLDNFKYDAFRYIYLSSRYWTHVSENDFTMHH